MIDHIDGEAVYRYPDAGDPRPPGGAKVLLLTVGHVLVTGPWSDDGRYLAWAPLPKRNKDKEAFIEKEVPACGD